MHERSGLKPGRRVCRWPGRLIAFPVAGTILVTGVLNAGASTPSPVTGWIRHHATVLGTVDPAAPLDDLAPLGPPIDVIIHCQVLTPAQPEAGS
jgi:hypothetical protein